MSRRFTLLASLLLASVLAACGGPTVTGVVSVQVLGGDRDVVITTTVLLTPLVTAGSGVATSVTWSSDDEDVATVDSDGVVHALGLGTTTVTAASTADATKSGTAVITVVKPTVADSAFMATITTPAGTVPPTGAALLLLSTQPAPPVARAAVTELEWPLFVGPMTSIADDGTAVVKLPPGSDLPADVLDTADKLYWGIETMPDCSLATSSPAVQVTPVAFEFISVPGVMLFGFEGARPAVISNFPIDTSIPPTAEQLAALALYTWVYATGDVSVVTSGSGCDFGGGPLAIDVELAQGWNQLEWQLEVDELTADLTGLNLVNSAGAEIYISALGAI